MKKIFYSSAITLSIISLLFITSCSKDDGPGVSPIVGVWELGKITISDPPAGYAFAATSTPSSVYGETSYEIEFLADNTYERTIHGTNPRFEDDGTWELNAAGDELDLDQDNTNVEGLPVSFEIQDGEITDEMVLITQDFWFAWPPEILNDPNMPLDTLFDGSSDDDEINAFFEEYGAFVEFTYTLEFDKQ